MKKFLRISLVLALLAGGGYWVYKTLFAGSGSASRDVWAFVPEDFVYVIETDKPIEDWQAMSGSKVWKFLKTHPYFADITKSADYLDELLTKNKTITSLVKLGGCLISAHMTGPKTYDFVILADLKGNANVGSALMPILTPIIESQDYSLSEEQYFNYTLYNMHDPKAGDTFTFGFVGKVLVGSYSKDLVKKAIVQTESENVLNKAELNLVQGKMDRDTEYGIYFNYTVFDRFLLSYTNELPETMRDFNEILTYSAFDFGMNDFGMGLSGVTKQNDSVASYLTVFRDVGRGTIHAHDVLPDNTAMFTSLGFDKFLNFYTRFMAQYEQESPEEYKDLQKSKKLIEGLLKFDLEEDLFSWVTGEVVTAVVPMPTVIDSTGTEGATTPDGGTYAYFAMLHFDDGEMAREKMDYFAKRVKKRTPAKFEEYDYKDYPIKYLKMKGFFNLFFKKMFSKIETPHYAFVGDYVVFTNDTVSMHRLIDSYLAEKTLAKSEDYKAFMGNFESSGNGWMYLQTKYFYDYMRKDMDYETRATLDKSREFMYAFPQVGFQLFPNGGMYRTKLYGEYKADRAVITP